MLFKNQSKDGASIVLYNKGKLYFCFLWDLHCILILVSQMFAIKKTLMF